MSNATLPSLQILVKLAGDKSSCPCHLQVQLSREPVLEEAEKLEVMVEAKMVVKRVRKRERKARVVDVVFSL